MSKVVTYHNTNDDSDICEKHTCAFILWPLILWASSVAAREEKKNNDQKTNFFFGGK